MNQLKISVLELRQIYESLAVLSKMKLPIKASYWVSRSINLLSKEYEASAKTHNELIERLGTKDENGGTSISPENVDAFGEFLKQNQEILTQEIEISVPFIPFEYFGDIEIEPSILLALFKVITPPENM